MTSTIDVVIGRRIVLCRVVSWAVVSSREYSVIRVSYIIIVVCNIIVDVVVLRIARTAREAWCAKSVIDVMFCEGYNEVGGEISYFFFSIDLSGLLDPKISLTWYQVRRSTAYSTVQANSGSCRPVQACGEVAIILPDSLPYNLFL